jgi:hypothetical protein
MSQFDAVLRHVSLIWMIETVMPMVLLDRYLNRTTSPFNVSLTTLAGMLYTPGVFNPRSPLTGRKKLEIFLRGRPAGLTCLNRTLLMCLKVLPTEGRNASVAGC